ncbi:unnamed protein product [Toxocara canis]|uniref:ShKT domain-containing protein n=1 Tax=Toxocara canis TaxID=6265 RepID=A0A183TXU9_TOXCA|nr:unnamed protein product [Toxocara canis]
MLCGLALFAIVGHFISVGTVELWTKCDKNMDACPDTVVPNDESLSSTVCAYIKKLTESNPATENDKPALKEIHKLCAKTYEMCCRIPEYDCSDASPTIYSATSADACKFIKDSGFCKSEVSAAARACPATCGLCTYSGPAGCQDKDHASCVELSKFCTSPSFNVFLNETCPWTCNNCPKTKNLFDQMGAKLQ